jgi:hypothetical protein
MKRLDGFIYKGHNDKVYVIYPESNELIDAHEDLHYIIAEANIIKRVRTRREAEDELHVFIELNDR